MSERWRRPAHVLTIEEGHPEGLWLPDGRVQGQVRLVVMPETAERMRLGYLCMKCLEPFEHAWPERCHVCGAPVREQQGAYFAAEFGGHDPGKGFDPDEEAEQMHDELRKEREP